MGTSHILTQDPYTHVTYHKRYKRYRMSSRPILRYWANFLGWWYMHFLEPLRKQINSGACVCALNVRALALEKDNACDTVSETRCNLHSSQPILYFSVFAKALPMIEQQNGVCTVSSIFNIYDLFSPWLQHPDFLDYVRWRPLTEDETISNSFQLPRRKLKNKI